MKEWVLDASSITDELAVFMPIEKDGSIVAGLMFGSDRCPGKLVGVVHPDGQEALEKWVQEHPDWYERFKKEADDGDT